MTPSYAFVGQPPTNGVGGRFFRTLKEQLGRGRVFETLEDLRDAIRAFIARYNAEWLVEKNGDLGPHALRRQHALAATPRPASPNRVPKEPGPVHQIQAPARPKTPLGAESICESARFTRITLTGS